MESREIEQRTNKRFCFKLSKTATETHEMLVMVDGDAAASRKAVYKWFERCRCAAESTEVEKRSCRPSTSTTDENVSNVNRHQSSACHLLSRCFLLGLFFDPEAEGETSVDFQRTTRLYIPEDSTFISWSEV
jgi:hypothetical protein